MPTLPSGLPEHIDDVEDLARFLTQSSQFTKLPVRMVKPAAFLPNPKDRETSVSRHGRTPVEVLWNLGSLAAGERTLYGAAIISAGAVRGLKLEVAADEPPDRHAVIWGWPWNESDPQMQKAAQKELAVFLASAAEPMFK